MTQDEIIRMAREAGAYKNCDVWQMNAELFERFAALVAEATKRDVITLCKNWDFNVQGLIRQIEELK